MSLRVGVTGASGFIGKHVVAALATLGHHALPVRRPFQPAALSESFRELDVIVHLAGVVSAVRDVDYESGNVEATRVVAQAARLAGVRLVHISSLAAAGPAPASAPRSELDPAAPINIYGRTKLAGEGVVRNTIGLDAIILRPGVVYGPGDRALLPLFRYARWGLLPMVGSGGAYTFIYIDDAVQAIVAAIERGPTGDVIFLGHRQAVTPRDLLDGIRATVGVRALAVHLPRFVVGIAARVGDLTGVLTGTPATINSRRFAELYSDGFVCRVDRMAERLDVSAGIDLRDGLARARRWYGEQGWL